VETYGTLITTALGIFGMPCFTAWSGLNFIGKPKSGETIAVAAASGPVGSMVDQLARPAGATQSRTPQKHRRLLGNVGGHV